MWAWSDALEERMHLLLENQKSKLGDIDEIRDQLKKKDFVITQNNEEIGILKKQLASIQLDHQKEMDDLESELASELTKLEEARNEILSLSSLTSSNSNKQTHITEEVIEDIQLKLEQKQNKIYELESVVRDLNGQLQKWVEASYELEKMESLLNSVDSLKNQLAQKDEISQREMDDLKKQTQELVADMRNTMDQQLVHFQASERKLNNELLRAKQSQEALTQSNSTKDDEIANQKLFIQTLKTTNDEALATQKDLLGRLTTINSEHKQELKSLRDSLSEQKTLVFKEKQATLEVQHTLNEKEGELKRKMKECSDLEPAYKKMRLDNETLKIDLAKKEVEVAQLTNLRKTQQRELDDLMTTNNTQKEKIKQQEHVALKKDYDHQRELNDLRRSLTK